MFFKIRKDLQEGYDRVRWFGSLLGERVRVEISIIKLLLQSSNLERERERLLLRLGTRVYELRERGSVNVYADRQVAKTLRDLSGLDQRLKGLREQAAQMDEAHLAD